MWTGESLNEKLRDSKLKWTSILLVRLRRHLSHSVSGAAWISPLMSLIRRNTRPVLSLGRPRRAKMRMYKMKMENQKTRSSLMTRAFRSSQSLMMAMKR